MRFDLATAAEAAVKTVIRQDVAFRFLNTARIDGISSAFIPSALSRIRTDENELTRGTPTTRSQAHNSSPRSLCLSYRDRSSGVQWKSYSHAT